MKFAPAALIVIFAMAASFFLGSMVEEQRLMMACHSAADAAHVEGYHKGYMDGHSNGHALGWIVATQTFMPPAPEGMSPLDQEEAMIRLYRRWKAGEFRVESLLPANQPDTCVPPGTAGGGG